MNLDLQESKFYLLAVSELLALFQQEKIMYTLKWRCILCTRGYLKSWQRPTLHATLIFYAFTLLALYTGYKLEGF